MARRTGLAPQTVSAVLDDLIAAGLVVRGQVRRSGGRGQPATPLYANPRGAYAIGAEIGWQHIDVALVNFAGEVVEMRHRDYPYPDGRTIFSELAALVGEITSGLGAEGRGRIIGMGLAAPGGIGDTASLLAPPPGQVEAWAGIDFAAEAGRTTGLNVQVYNDGNAACWAEFVAHRSPRPGDFAYLLIDTFVAAGIIAEDRLWEGVTGASANLGSMLVTDRRGTPRFVHEIASLHALGERLRAQGTTQDMALADAPPPEAQATLAEWIDDAALALAQTILNAATVLEFDFAVIDARLPPEILARIVAATSQKILEVPSLGRIRPTVRRALLERPGAAQGAAFLRMYRRFYSRELAHMDAE